MDTRCLIPEPHDRHLITVLVGGRDIYCHGGDEPDDEQQVFGWAHDGMFGDAWEIQPVQIWTADQPDGWPEA